MAESVISSNLTLAGFEEIDLAWIRGLLAEVNQEWQDENRDFYDGEHWSPGGLSVPEKVSSGWVGPRPPTSDPMYAEVMGIIESGFVSSNKIKEVVDRLINGVLSREPNWTVTVARPLDEGEEPTGDESTLIEEADAMLVEWWDKRGLLEILQETGITSALEERGSVRLYVPKSKMRGAALAVGNVQEWMMRIYAHHCRPGQAMVYSDPDSMDEAGLYLYMQGQDEVAEAVWLREGKTIIRLLGSIAVSPEPLYSRNGDEEDAEFMVPGLIGEWEFDFGGNLTIHELRRSLLITTQVKAAQKLLNKALTMMSRNLDSGGFLERVIINGQMPGHYEPDDDAPGGRVWVPDPHRMGPGYTTYVAGLEDEDPETGRVVRTTPQMVYREPVNIGTFVASARTAYLAILEEVQQLHAAIAGDANTSGEARIQAMAAFISDLLQFKSKVDKLGRAILETALAMAAALAGRPGRYAALRVNFDCRIDPGPIPADVIRLITERYEKRLLSRPTAMSLQGVDDVDAEMALMDAEDEAAMSRGMGQIPNEGEEGVPFPASEEELTDENTDNQEELSDAGA